MQDRGPKKHKESLIEEARQLLAAHSEDGIDSPRLQPPKNAPPISQFASRCSQANRAQTLLQRMQAQRLEVPNSGDFE